MEIRDATPTDIVAITQIYGRSVVEETASFELTPPAEDEMLSRMKAVVDGGYPYLVAQLDGVVAGYAYASAFRTRPAYHATVENTVYVAPQSQRHGVGKALLEALIDECRLRGFRQMVAGIGGAKNMASIRLHEACGFKMVGHFREVGFKHDQWLDVFFMQRAL